MTHFLALEPVKFASRGPAHPKKMRILTAVFMYLCALVIFALPAPAAQSLTSQERGPFRSAPGAEVPYTENQYQSDLFALADVLGATHAVRSLCFPEEATLWRDSMLTLLQLAEPVPAEREALSKSFNAAYDRTRDDYFECDRKTMRLSERLAQEGRVLTERLAASLAALGGGAEE